jgi:hypothetical protein
VSTHRPPRTLAELRALPFIGEVTREGHDGDVWGADLDLRWLPPDWLHGDVGSILYGGTVGDLLRTLRHDVWPYLRNPETGEPVSPTPRPW